MTIIGIDLGTTTGWAVLTDSGDRLDSGYWHLHAGERAPAHSRFIGLRNHVYALMLRYCHTGEVMDVGYERPTYFGHLAPALVFGGFEAILLYACNEAHVPYHPIPVSHVKLAALGRGRVKKVPGVPHDPKRGMVEAAQVRWGLEHYPQPDEADALWTAEACRLAIQGGSLPWDNVPPKADDARAPRRSKARPAPVAVVPPLL